MKILNRLDNLRSFVEVLLQRARTKGGFWVLAKIVQKPLEWIAWMLLLPLSVLGHLAGFRRLTVFTDRIGHLAAELDCFEKERQLDLLPTRRRWFVLAPHGRIANAHLLGYWKTRVPVVTNRFLCGVLRLLSKWGPMVHDVSHYILSFRRSARYYEINRAWGQRPPVLTLTDADRLYTRTLLAELGVPPDAWFVCFHNREAGFSPVDEKIHSHRNVDIANYAAAMQYIVDRGGWCIRMGDPTMTPAPAMRGVVDYALHPSRSDRADVLLCASCRFFVGTSSGLFIVASVFGVPCALTNMIPMATLGYAPRDISIPKILHDASSRRQIAFPAAFGHAMSNFRLASQFSQAGIAPVENNATDILDLVREMHGTVDGTWRYDDVDNSLQARFRTLFDPHHYGEAAAGRIGALFLRAHRGLFDERP